MEVFHRNAQPHIADMRSRLSKKSSESWAFSYENGKIEEKRERSEQKC